MKIIIIILFFPIAGLGQSDTTAKTTLFSLGYSTLTIEKPVIDTARVMIVYCDTTFLGGDGMKRIFTMLAYVDTVNDIRIGEAENRFPGVFWQFGYEVNEKSIRDYYSVIRGGIFVDKPLYQYKHIAYLDEKKKPLSKSIVVIISIKL